MLGPRKHGSWYRNAWPENMMKLRKAVFSCLPKLEKHLPCIGDFVCQSWKMPCDMLQKLNDISYKSYCQQLQKSCFPHCNLPTPSWILFISVRRTPMAFFSCCEALKTSFHPGGWNGLPSDNLTGCYGKLFFSIWFIIFILSLWKIWCFISIHIYLYLC